MIDLTNGVFLMGFIRWHLYPKEKPEPFGFDYIITADTDRGRGTGFGRWDGSKWDTSCYPKEVGTVSIVAWAELPEPYYGGESDDDQMQSHTR